MYDMKEQDEPFLQIAILCILHSLIRDLDQRSSTLLS